ncbi:MAG: hypothetical protein ACK449_09760 [Planctomycetota bacterium]|jgi:hypothetical protein
MRFRRLVVAGLSAASFLGSSALVCTPMHRAYGQDTKTLEIPGFEAASSEGTDVVTLAIAPLDRLLPDITHVMRISGAGAQSGLITGAVNGYTSGLDRSRPIGGFVKLSSAGLPNGVLALPISDLDEFLGGLELFGEAEDLGEGLYSMNLGPNTLFAQFKNDWLFVSTAEEALEGAPENPGVRIEKMAAKNDLMFEVNVQNIPDELVDLLTSQMRTGFEQAMEAQSGDLSDAEIEANRVQGEQAMKSLEEAITGTDRFVFGLGVHPKEKNITIDFGAQMVDGSKLAKQLNSMKSMVSKLSGYITDSSAISAKTMSLIAPEDAAQMKTSVDQAKKAVYSQIEDQINNPAVSAKVKEYLDRLVTILTDSSSEGSVEAAVSVTTDPALNAIAVFSLADGAKVEALAQDLANEATNAGAPVTVKLMSGKHQGANLHNISVPLPYNADDKLRKVMGDDVKIAIATAPKSVYLSVGKNAESSLKTALDANVSNKTAPGVPTRLRVSMSQILNFVQTIESNPVVDGMLSSLSGGDDMILFDSKIIDRGGVNRITIQDGVIKAAAGGARAAMANQGGF